MHLTLDQLLQDGWCLIGALWIGSSAFSRPVRHTEGLAARLVQFIGGAIALALYFYPRLPVGPLNRQLLPHSLVTIIVGSAFCLLGWALAIWARLCLANNWSASVTLKQGHTLVQRGPYAAIRHPIYSGLLLALLGTAMVQGLTRSFVGLLLLTALWLTKADAEEQLLRSAFGDVYSGYQARTGALLPRLR
jgi:protein-S-isoprenylcysteine O-methyltransferase Ste14